VNRTRERRKRRDLDLAIGCSNMKRRVAIVESCLVQERRVGIQESCDNLKVAVQHGGEEAVVMVATATQALTHYYDGREVKNGFCYSTCS